jgi:ABC-2 type transport system permease protein
MTTEEATMTWEVYESEDFSPMAGFRNMMRKENARWWSTRSLLFQLTLWLIVLNGLVAVVLFLAPLGQPVSADSAQMIANSGMSVFFQLAGFTVFIGAIIFGHDALLKERESGTAAWLLSKPLSRKAFVLSKMTAIIIGVIGIILTAQGVITYAMCSIELGSPMPVLPFAAGLGVMALSVLFFLTLAMALGAFTTSRAITLGIPLIIGITGGLLLGMFKALNVLTQVGYFVPFNLTSYAYPVACGASLASDMYWPWPVLATAIWVLLFIAAAVARFERIEL